jgi:DNA-binding response OmpR family regulator
MLQALLLAESEPGTREFVERHLASDGFSVVPAAEGREALELAERERPDLVLVGGLPDAPALEVCRVLREGEPGRSWDRDVPVIVLGEARADAVDRVHAFARGCDDFVPRPFHYEELVARIHAVLRRTRPGERERLAAGPVAVDRATRRVTVHGCPVALAAKEYELLVKLASEPVRVFTKEELLREVWGFRSLGRTRTLDSHASRLRLKLARAGAAECVLNVWGVGYRLLADHEEARLSA